MKRVLLGLAAALLFAAPAQAADYEVNSLADTPGTCPGTPCTLRAAVTSAETTTDLDTITFALPGQIQLTGGALTVTKPLTITGQGANQTTITAGTERVLDADATTLNLNDLSLQGGTGDVGGSLRALDSTVTLSRVRVYGGTAQSGGGIANVGGTLAINQSLIDHNTASQGDANGGGVANLGNAVVGAAALTIANSTIAFNTARVGGGLVSTGDAQNSVSTTGVTIGQNHGNDVGGGVHIGAGSWLAQLTLVADNFQEQAPNNCTGTDGVSQGWNLETGDECGFTQEVDKRNVVNARLATELNANGGPTLTLMLKAGSQALNIRAGCTGVDQRGVARPQGAGCDAGAFESELAPAVPPVITAPTQDLHTNAPELQFAGTAEPNAAIELYLNNGILAMTDADAQGAWATAIEAPTGDGAYTFGVSQNGSPRATVTVTMDRVRPDTFIDSGPPPTSTSSTATFTYSASEPDTTFSCSFFGPGHPDTTFGPCPASYTNLANGEYTFKVQATDRAGNTDSDAASRTFLVDTTPVAAPDVSEPVVEPSAATFTFSTAQADRTFRCRLEGPGQDGAFAPCTSPQRYDGLTPGDYSFTARSSDSAGSFADSAARTFSIAAPPAAVATQPTPTPTPVPVQTVPPTPQPDVGATVVIRPTGGKVLIQLLGTNQFAELTAIEELPLGTTIDARNGRIQLRFETEDGKVQTGVFYGGIFQVRQVGKILDLKLTEALAACPKKGKASSAQSTKKAKKRKLWGDGKGSFRTTGKHSAATVRGTKWLVEDSCAGTLTRVTSGVVAVRAGKKTVLVRAGKQYLAKPR